MFLWISWLALSLTVQAHASSMVEGLPGEYHGYDLENLATNHLVSCSAKIEAKDRALIFVLNVKGKGQMTFGPEAIADLQSQLVLETEFRDRQAPEMDPHRSILHSSIENKNGSTTNLSIGWVDGQLSDLAISSWPTKESLHCAGFQPRH